MKINHHDCLSLSLFSHYCVCGRVIRHKCLGYLRVQFIIGRKTWKTSGRCFCLLPHNFWGSLLRPAGLTIGTFTLCCLSLILILQITYLAELYMKSYFMFLNCAFIFSFISFSLLRYIFLQLQLLMPWFKLSVINFSVVIIFLKNYNIFINSFIITCIHTDMRILYIHVIATNY